MGDGLGHVGVSVGLGRSGQLFFDSLSKSHRISVAVRHIGQGIDRSPFRATVTKAA
jgi:hypothetical protein